MRCMNQHIMGMGGPVDIRQDIVFDWMRRYKVDPDQEEYCFDLVYAAYRRMMEIQKQKAEREHEARRNIRRH